ncbi:MAG: head GIN domain-containing protein [Bacteroidota bacterium]
MKSHTIPLFALLLCMSSCYDGSPWQGIEGQGPIVERKIKLDHIRGISVPGSAKVYLTQGDNQDVRIEGQENIIDNLNTTVTGEVWRIENKRPVWRCETLKIYITMEQLRMIRISGSGDVFTSNHFENLKDLEIKVSGSGDLDLDIEADDIYTRVSGSGNITMRGKADRLDSGISGSGHIRASELEVHSADLHISGSGDMELYVTDRLTAHVSGSGNVFYSGNPSIDTSITGSGHVRSR